MQSGRLQTWLAKAPPWLLTLYAITVAFSAYFCMYAFRKPFAAGTYAGETFGPLTLKTALVISQILGYTLSKYLGIKFCSEARPHQRAWMLIALVGSAEATLLLFGLVPPTWRLLAIFANGIPLGMVWGLVVSYVEGRRTSDLLMAGLSCSFIMSSGIVKDAGLAFLSLGVGEAWMPAVTGACFLPPFVLMVWLLNQLPPPTAADIAVRVARQPMDGRARWAFVRRFGVGLVLLLVLHILLNAYRDFRDNYGRELLEALGYGEMHLVFTRTEVPVAFGVMLALACVNLFRDNRRGLSAALGMILGGLLLMGAATFALHAGYVSGLWWMLLVGLGSYLAYVPFHSVLFERLIAATGVTGTAVFAIALADATGYTGSVGIQLYKDLVNTGQSRLAFFTSLTLLLAVVGSVLIVAAWVYFMRVAAPGREIRRASAPDTRGNPAYDDASVLSPTFANHDAPVVAERPGAN